MILVKPATVVQWHRKGFRLHWRRRSRRPGRPKIGTEIRALIRRMSRANPLWGAPRIHGELLKLGIKISQATVGRWMPWRPDLPSPTWRTFLRNHLPDMAAIDMFVVATATFQLLYALIVLSLDRRRVVHFELARALLRKRSAFTKIHGRNALTVSSSLPVSRPMRFRVS